MDKYTFTFSEEDFNKVFPFYILLDANLTICSLGKSVIKLYPSLHINDDFTKQFKIKRPYIDAVTPGALLDILNQLVILECCDDAEVVLRGQFELTGGNFLFVGSPWFISVEEVKKNRLSIFDFANYDPSLDLLQILKSQELTALELKEQLKINDEQKEELNRDRSELNRLSLVASANENAIIFTHPNAEIFWCNDAYLKLTGFSREEIMGRTPVEVGRTEITDSDALKDMISRFYNGQSFDVEIVHGRKDGSHFWTRTHGQPIYDKDGRIMQFFAMIEDKTAEKENEEQLILLSLIAQKNMNAVIICDAHGNIEWVNPSFNALSGYSNEELIGKRASTLFEGPETDKAVLAYIRQQLQTGEPFSCEVINYDKQGKKYWIKIQGQALFNTNGELTRFFAIQEDITSKKALESQTLELVKSLEKSNHELEDYAQIVSHDLKSPLRSINSLMAWIKEENEGTLSEQTLMYFDMIDNKLEKMEHLIQGVLTFSKIDKTDLAKENVDVNDVVNNIINIIHIPDGTSITIKNKLPVIRADRYRMQQLFQNLIGNAVAYIDKAGGIVEVGVEPGKGYYTFYVKDNGPGIAKENHEKIFKMFQSLVKNEKATGLGLSIVKKIVDNYKGTIWLESELGQGTTFFVQLPK